MGAPHHRSGFEARLRERLDAEGVQYVYEAEAFPLVMEVPGARCFDCDSKQIVKPSRYTPDFFFADWIVEAKGKFTAKDRKRVMALLNTFAVDHQRRKFGMLFMRDNKISKSSTTRYSDWCKKMGIEFSIGWFKQEWLK